MRRGLVPLVVLALLFVGLPAPRPAHAADAADAGRPSPGDPVPGVLLVTSSSPPAAATLDRTLAAAADVSEVTRLTDEILLVRTPPGGQDELTARIRALPGAVSVEEDRYRELSRTPDDPGFPRQWAHRLTGAPAAWAHTTGSRDVRVAVLDGGVDATLADLAPNVVKQVRAVDGSVTMIAPHGGRDNDVCRTGHGTATAGVLGAVGDNGYGLAGVAWQVAILDVGLVSPGSGACEQQLVTDSAAIAGLRYALEHPDGPPDVVNLSFGAPAEACPRAWQQALDDAEALDTMVVAAAGNGGRTRPNVPASCDGVVSVGAADASGRVAPYSDHSEQIDLLAPGGSGLGEPHGLVATVRAPAMACTTPVDGVAAACAVAGTSFAAPYVAGVAALVRTLRPDASVERVEGVLEHTARHPASPGGRDPGSGWGVVQAGAAVARAAAPGPLPAAAPDPRFPVEVPRLAGSGTTVAVTQALAASRATFGDGEATHVLLARDDDYADALAGTVLASGGPLLYTPPDRPLTPLVLSEIRRVLPSGGPVFVLGGPAAVAPLVIEQLRGAGLRPQRLAGDGREQTAVAVGEQARGDGPVSAVVLARGYAWPDAVAAGPLAAHGRVPILLARPDHLPAATARALQRWRPQLVLVAGSTAAVSQDVAQAAGRAAGARVQRLGGANRMATAVALAEETRRRLPASAQGTAGMVNMYRADGWAHILSAVPLLARDGGVLLPLGGDRGGSIPAVTSAYLDAHDPAPVVIGGADLVASATLERLQLLPR